MPKKITDELELVIRDEFIHGYVDANGERKYPLGLRMVIGRLKRTSIKLSLSKS